MSNKFLKILGICILIIMLPVLITVSAVCLVEDAKVADSEKTTYTVYSAPYAAETTLEIKDGVWKLQSVPVRAYYTFDGIVVNRNFYAVAQGVVVLNAEQKTTFEKDVKANFTITSAWTCDYSYINVALVPSSNLYQLCEYNGGYDLNTGDNDIEGLGIFTTLNYSAFATTPINTFDVSADINGNTTIDAGETFTLTFSAEDKLTTGDITVRKLLDKLAAQNVTLPKNASSIAKIIING